MHILWISAIFFQIKISAILYTSCAFCAVSAILFSIFKLSLSIILLLFLSFDQNRKLACTPLKSRYAHCYKNLFFRRVFFNSKSTVCNKQLSKICAITALCTDIIFLSDIRLNSNPEHIEKVKKLFLYNPIHSYEAFFNSTKNSRGVGILISTRLTYTVKKHFATRMKTF